MLKRHNQFFKSLMVVNDIVFLSLAWWMAFWVRFHSGWIALSENYVVHHYVLAWWLILCTWSLVFGRLDLYRPRRISTHLREAADIVKGCGLAILLFLGMIFLLHDIILSRFVVVFSGLRALPCLILATLFVERGSGFCGAEDTTCVTCWLSVRRCKPVA